MRTHVERFGAAGPAGNVERIKERYEDAKSLLTKFDARYTPLVPPKWEVNLALALILTLASS